MYYLFHFKGMKIISRTKYFCPEYLSVAEANENGEIIDTMKYAFVPIDVNCHSDKTIKLFFDNWEAIILKLIERMNIERTLIFLTQSDMIAFHTVKRKLHLHTNSLGTYFLQKYISNIDTIDFYSEETIFSRMIEVFKNNESELRGKNCDGNIAISDRAQMGILSCQSYLFFGDRKTMLYHKRTCEDIGSINTADLQGCGKSPQKSGFSPCPKCIGIEIKKAMPSQKDELAFNESKILSKGEAIKKQIEAICSKYGMYAEIFGGTAYITTVAGEWYFSYNDRPIILRHKNAEMRYKRDGTSTGLYHVQNQTFYSPLHVLTYIKNHENAEIKRLMENEQLQDDLKCI